jgi:hypothetical protein
MGMMQGHQLAKRKYLSRHLKDGLFRFCLSALTAILATKSATANEQYDRYFAKIDDGNPCYLRTYDAAHLRQHPRQKIRRIELSFKIGNSTTGKPSTSSAFGVTLGLMAKDKSERFSSPAYCSAQSSSFLCQVESDGGTFRLRPAAGGALTLQVVGDGLRMEGLTGFIEVGGKASDDNLFVLPHTARHQCSRRQ